MSSLGEITLRFGATGKAGEQPLRFKSGHINLLVGPNNAGKSLMLQELSGSIREKNRRRPRKTQYPETRVVASVDYSEECAQGIKQTIVETVFDGEEPWPELKAQPWNVLIPALEQAVQKLTTLRDDLSPNLLILLKISTNEEVARFIGQIGIDWKKGGPLLILGAVGVLGWTRFNVESSIREQSASLAGQPARPQLPLSEEQAEELRQILEATWSDCQKVFASLGVDVTDLTFDGLLNAKILAGVLLKKVADVPFLAQLIAQHPGSLGSLLLTPRRSCCLSATRTWAVGCLIPDR